MPRIFKAASCVIHAIVITAVSYLQIFSPGLLPSPREALAYESPRIVIGDLPLPPRPRSTPVPAAAADRNAAPIVEPAAVTPEPVAPVDTASAGAVRAIENTSDVFGAPGLPGDGPPPPPAPPPPPPPQPVRLHSGMQAPVKTVHVDPVYPALAQSSRKEGIVILEAVIDARGAVESVRVLRSQPLLDAAAVAAVQQWRFTPALLNGQPVPVVMTVTVNFSLK
jgi:protein TonB